MEVRERRAENGERRMLMDGGEFSSRSLRARYRVVPAEVIAPDAHQINDMEQTEQLRCTGRYLSVVVLLSIIRVGDVPRDRKWENATSWLPTSK